MRTNTNTRNDTSSISSYYNDRSVNVKLPQTVLPTVFYPRVIYRIFTIEEIHKHLYSDKTRNGETYRLNYSEQRRTFLSHKIYSLSNV